MSSSDERPQAEAENTKVVEISQIVHEDIQPTRLAAEEPPRPEEASSKSHNDQQSPTTKRKASQSASPGAKRPRLSSPTSQRSPIPKSRDRRPSSSTTTCAPRLDEKARSRRLFGGILSTIAQKPKPSTSSTHRREHAERRAAERAKERVREEEDARREREIRRRAENAERWGVWERECLMARWGNERYKAGFLRARSEPSLYYKPYILFPSQKETLALQAAETERVIEAEMREYEDTHHNQPAFPRRAAQSSLLDDMPRREGDVVKVKGRSVDPGIEGFSLRRRSSDDGVPVLGDEHGDGHGDERRDGNRDEEVVVRKGDDDFGGVNNLDGSHDVRSPNSNLNINSPNRRKEEGKNDRKSASFVGEVEATESLEQWRRNAEVMGDDDDDDEDVIETSEGVALIY